jgi:hypothetical protein
MGNTLLVLLSWQTQPVEAKVQSRCNMRLLFFCPAISRRLTLLKWILIALCAILLTACQSVPVAERSENAQRFSFALIGDLPYQVPPFSDYPPLEHLVADINRNKDLQWVIHTGDIKSSRESCSDEMFRDRLNRFRGFDKPLIYTPGDNEWTDCHKVSAGEYHPLERLQRLRELFFPTPGQSLGSERMQLESQASTPGYASFPENVRWSREGIVFATLHVVGSHNGLAPFDPEAFVQRSQADDDEVAQRIDAAVAWIAATFRQAVEEQARGVFLVMQANPQLEAGHNLPSGPELAAARRGFTAILESLEEHTLAFAKPVVLAHGDSHYFRVDKPGLIKRRFIANFTRVENFGPGRVHWVEVTVEPDAKNLFSFKPMIVEANQ